MRFVPTNYTSGWLPNNFSGLITEKYFFIQYGNRRRTIVLDKARYCYSIVHYFSMRFELSFSPDCPLVDWRNQVFESRLFIFWLKEIRFLNGILVCTICNIQSRLSELLSQELYYCWVPSSCGLTFRWA